MLSAGLVPFPGRGFEDAFDFGDRQGIALSAVIGRNDGQLRFGAVEVRAPVGNDAIAAVRRVTFAAIADDRVIR